MPLRIKSEIAYKALIVMSGTQLLQSKCQLLIVVPLIIEIFRSMQDLHQETQVM